MKRTKAGELLIQTPTGNITYSEAQRRTEKMRAQVQKGRESRNDKFALNPPTIYTSEHIVSKNGAPHLEVRIAGRKQFLPLINIGTQDQPTYIAIVNPKLKAITEHGSKSLAHILSKLGIKLVVTPPSSKSEVMVAKAAKRAKIAEQPLTIAGGSINTVTPKRILTREEVRVSVDDGTQYWIVECRPITLGPNDPSKYFGLNETMLARIIAQVQQGNPIAIVDDVYSSGATIAAIKKLISDALYTKQLQMPDMPIVVIAQERPEHLLEQSAGPEIYSDIVIPVLSQI